MTDDARFEDGAEAPLNLRAETTEDLGVLSALLQDAVLSGADMAWDRKARRLALLVNRFRWEDRAAAELRGRSYERVRSLLLVEGALTVASQGLTRGDGDTVLSILSLAWEPGEDGAGAITLTLAGDGAIRVGAEYLGVTLRDVTRPYAAPSGMTPRHPD
jgi:hypothetical protein